MTDQPISTNQSAQGGDDFMTQIQTAEAEAVQIEATARQQAHKDVQAYRNELATAREEQINERRDVIKEELTSAAKKSRINMEARTKDGVADAQKFKDTKMAQVKNVAGKKAYDFLLGQFS